MKQAIIDALKSTKAKIVYLAVTIAAVFKFIGDFKVPGDRIGYLRAALEYVWPDVLLLLIVFLLLGFKKLWLPPLGRRLRKVLPVGLQQKCGRPTVILAVLVAVGTGAVAQERASTAYYQALSAVESRWQVYRYAFGYRYSDSLRARAIEDLAAGRPETADRLLARAERWTFGSPSLSANIKELRLMAQSRIELSGLLSRKRSTRAQLASLRYADTAALTTAYVLNTESDGLRKELKQRSAHANQFADFLQGAIADCGQHVNAADEAAFRNSCIALAAEQLDAKSSGCGDAAQLLCQRLGLSGQSDRQRARRIRDFVAGATGAMELHAIIGESP